MYGYPPSWQQPQGFGGTPYPVFIPTPQSDGKPPRGKSLVKQFKQWKEFQDMMNGKSGGSKSEEKKDDNKPKIPMYTFSQVLLILWASSIPVGFFSLYVYVQLAKNILGPIASTLGFK